SAQMTWQIPWPEFLKKRLCRYLLQHYLGHFFKEKISLEQLSIDIYNGTGCVKDLHLDCDALNEQLDASLASASPIHIVSGFVGYISVSIPWHDLFSDSCKLLVKNVQVTIRTKHSADVAQPAAHFADSMANSMFSSVIIDSLMNTSMHIAQECLGENKLDESKAPLLGLEAFASTIDSILSRIQISLEQIQIRVEHLDKAKVDLSKSSAPVFSQEWSASGIALELRIKSVKYFDEESASGQDSLPARNTTKNFCVQGLTCYFDEFMVRDDLAECRSEPSVSGTEDECPPFNFDLDPNYYLYTSPVILVTFAGVQSLKLTVNNMRPTDLMLEAASPGNQVAAQQRPFLQVSAQFGAIKCLLCPKQIHLLTDMVNKIVEYMDSVQRMKQEVRMDVMKKKIG
ncbi:autophagy-related 2 -like protein, partial [Brachionus plicatilis]